MDDGPMAHKRLATALLPRHSASFNNPEISVPYRYNV